MPGKRKFLSLMLTHFEDEQREIPAASSIKSLSLTEDAFATYISCDTSFEASAVKIKIARPAKLKYLRLGYFTDIQAEPVP